jgi:hypothetical protein
MRRKALFIAGLILAALTAHAQRALPSDVDLKSAYCVQVKQSQAALLETAAQKEPSGSQLEVALRKELEGRRTDISRLQSYLIPKLDALQPDALLAASLRARADLADLDKNQDNCLRCNSFFENGRPTDKWSACMNACLGEIPAYVRMNSCKTVNWLPF